MDRKAASPTKKEKNKKKIKKKKKKKKKNWSLWTMASFGLNFASIKLVTFKFLNSARKNWKRKTFSSNCLIILTKETFPLEKGGRG